MELECSSTSKIAGESDLDCQDCLKTNGGVDSFLMQYKWNENVPTTSPPAQVALQLNQRTNKRGELLINFR